MTGPRPGSLGRLGGCGPTLLEGADTAHGAVQLPQNERLDPPPPIELPSVCRKSAITLKRLEQAPGTTKIPPIMKIGGI
ncbi:hypothetical protein [Streptomyces sp. NBC_00038]|uniref:hypothetical protein n=1 Tax=Streptomyces sp. NBC_00038 TaxID=2903615 RepID=UPI002252C8BC|nr:hypothetical protein [Streptomyces sp. NBC_00038]MCX5554488.1 hypothetical protein [Streptomyces sp. NBC_00038]